MSCWFGNVGIGVVCGWCVDVICSINIVLGGSVGGVVILLPLYCCDWWWLRMLACWLGLRLFLGIQYTGREESRLLLRTFERKKIPKCGYFSAKPFLVVSWSELGNGGGGSLGQKKADVFHSIVNNTR